MLFNYLLHYRDDTKSPRDEKGVYRGPFADYLRKVQKGPSLKLAAHPVHATLFMNSAELEKAFAP